MDSLLSGDFGTSLVTWTYGAIATLSFAVAMLACRLAYCEHRRFGSSPTYWLAIAITLSFSSSALYFSYWITWRILDGRVDPHVYTWMASSPLLAAITLIGTLAGAMHIHTFTHAARGWLCVCAWLFLAATVGVIAVFVS